MFTPGSRACAYRTASGQANWPNRDPVGEVAFLEQHSGGKSFEEIPHLVEKALFASYAFVDNNPIVSIDLLGLEDVQIVVTTVIRPPDVQAGVKTIHSVVVNEYGQITGILTFTGQTIVGGIGITGTSTFRQWVMGIHPNFTVSMLGSSISAFLPSILAIDYNLDINLDFCSRTAAIGGIHDGYPSYEVRVKGDKVYDYHQRNRGDLLPPEEISVYSEFQW